MADAAQEFLNKQLSKNRFTAQQQSRLDNNGGPSVVGSGNGIVPAGEAYAKYGKMPGTADPTSKISPDSETKASTKPVSTGSDAYKDFDVNDKYKSGQWGSGKLSQQDLADKYGLDTSAEANKGDTAVWGTNRSGDRVFLGNIDNSFRSNDDVIKAHLAQADSGEAKHGDIPESVSSDGDVIGAMLNMWDGGGGPDKTEAPKEEEPERTPIEHSPEIKQAAERVRAYEDNIMSGKTSSDIFGDTYGNTGLELNNTSNKSSTDAATDTNTGATNNQTSVMDRINDKYSVSFDQGNSGIGTSSNTEDTSTSAANSFLSSKKTGYKKAYNFKPQTNLSYRSK